LSCTSSSDSFFEACLAGLEEIKYCKSEANLIYIAFSLTVFKLEDVGIESMAADTSSSIFAAVLKSQLLHGFVIVLLVQSIRTVVL
jgi:hypothetical protein